MLEEAPLNLAIFNNVFVVPEESEEDLVDFVCNTVRKGEDGGQIGDRRQAVSLDEERSTDDCKCTVPPSGQGLFQLMD
jgi:hypothetical protein